MHGVFVRFTNGLILALIVVLTTSGLYSLLWPWPAWLFEVHRASGWALIALVPWKSIIAWGSLKRGTYGRVGRALMLGVSVVLAAVTLVTLALALLWAWRVGPAVLSLGFYANAPVAWHWMIALALLPLFALHVWRRWPRPRRADFLARRSVLKMLALGAAGVVGWAVAEGLAQGRQDAQSPRRFTGSREMGSYSGLAYPVTHSISPGTTPLDAAAWTLRVVGAVENTLTLRYAEVLALPAADVSATLDCTSGWYTRQVWRGVSLADVLSQAGVRPGATGIVLKDVLGYPALVTLDEAREIVLATHCGGQVLDHWHGFPVRAVVPARRGWQWVKWLAEVEVIGA